MVKPFLLLATTATALVVIAAPAHAEASDNTKSKQPTTHTVAEGEYLELIGQNLGIEWVRIWQKNPQLQNQDVINVGDVLTIPDKDETLTDRPLAQSVAPAPVATVQTPNSVQNVAPAVVPSRVSVGGPNGYVPGNCTWYVKNKRPDIGGYWGDAGYNWISAARAAGYATGSTPAAGAIGVVPGHVVYVESVNADGSANISEMNYAGLYSVRTRVAAASEFQYIY